MKSLSKILNADLHELVSLHLSRVDRQGFNGAYVSVLKHYLTNDTKALEAMITRLPRMRSLSEDERAWLSVLARARLAARLGEVTDSILEDLRAGMPDESQLRGEFWYVLALCHESRGESRLMSDAYLQASRCLTAGGVHAKSVKALFNHVAAEHRLHPEKRFLSDYQYCYREAKRHKVHSTAAMALVNLSREYQLVGGFDMALQHVNRALALLDRQRFARSYFLALAHRSHVLVTMGRREEALADYREAQLCTFPDVRTALETLKAIFAAAPAPQPALMSWEGRAQEALGTKEKPRLGALEQKLLQFLSEKPRTRRDMIELLYGTTLSPEVLENRFNNTFQRLKKKLPGLIVNQNGRFALAETWIENRYKKNA